MNSKQNLDKIIVDDGQKGILVEGDFGDLIDLSLLEDKLLEIQFSNGVLRLEVNNSELLQVTKKL